jgi:hypothetical protein
MKKIILILLFPVLVLAQDYELGKVTIAELNQKQHPTDSSAAAAILFSRGKSYFDYIGHFVLMTEIEVKIKIYKKEGLNWANKEIAYYIGGQDNESVLINKAMTYNLVNGKIEKTKFNADGEFNENVNKFWATKKITLPNVKEGSIIEYKYTIKSPHFSNLQDWKFQETIPVDYSEYKTIIPEYFSYNFYSRGNVKLNLKKETKHRTIVVYDEAISKRGLNIAAQHASTRIGLSENITIIDAKNVPALIEEEYSNNIENYLSSIQYQLASAQYPNQLIKMYSETWEDVTKHINDDSSFGEELKKDNYFESEYVNLIRGKTLNNNEKIDVIYNFVKNHYRWNESNGIYTDVGVNKAFKDRVGNVAEINFTLISMLRKAGLNANPVILTTRNRAINLYPSTTTFNYVVCGVEMGGKIIFMDATDKLLKPNVLPTRALNYIGRLVRQNGTSMEVDLSPKVHSKKSVMIFASIDNQSVKGNIKETLTENRAFNFRSKNSAISEESYLENIEKNMPGFEIAEYKIENKKDEKESLKDYNFTSTNEIEVINDKLFFKPLLFFAIDENPFKQDKRDYPIDFKYPTHDSYTLTYNLPQGYVVESMPEKMNIATEDNLSSFSFLIGQTGNKIQIVSNFYINSAMVPSDYYDTLKVFYNQVYLKMNEKIVLKKQ